MKREKQVNRTKREKNDRIKRERKRQWTWSLEEIRKRERESILYLKRNEGYLNVEEYIEDAASNPQKLQNMLESLPVIAYEVSSCYGGFHFAAAAKLNFLLSIEDPPIDQVINIGVVPHLVKLLQDQDAYLLCARAANALVGLTCGTLEHSKVVIENGAIPIFVQLLGSERDVLQGPAVQALGNIAVESPHFRDLVLGEGAITPLLALLEKHSEPPIGHKSMLMLKYGSHVLAKLCHGIPPQAFNQVNSALPILRRLIHLDPIGVPAENICENACLTLSCLSKGGIEQIQTVLDANISDRLIVLLHHQHSKVIEHVLTTVGNIFQGSSFQIQVLINNEVFPTLHHVLEHEVGRALRRACWAISIMTAGSASRIQQVIEGNMIPPLVRLLQHHDNEVRCDAICALSNATRRGSHEQIRYLANEGCIIPFCNHLLCLDRRTTIRCLEGLNNFLKVGEVDKGEGVNVYAQVIDEANGFSILEVLQPQPDFEMAEKILIKYRNWKG